MAWTKPTAKDILGIDEVELKTKLDAAEATKTTVDQLSTTVNTKFEELTAMLKGLQVQPNAQPQNTNTNTQNQQVKTEEKLPSFFEDEDEAFNSRAKKVMGPILELTLRTNATIVSDKVRAKHSDYGLFEEEINKELKDAPLHYLANEQYIENAYTMVKGRHVDEIADHRAKRQGKYFVEGVSTSGNHVPNNGRDDKAGVQLSEDELKYVQKFGITADEYAKVKGSLKYV